MRVVNHECDRAHEWVSLELDSELSEFEATLLSAHLAECSECREFQRDVAGLTLELRAAELERLERPVSVPSRRRLSLRPLQASAAALAVAAVGLGSLFGSLQLQSGSRVPEVSSDVITSEEWRREFRNYQFEHMLGGDQGARDTIARHRRRFLD